MKVLKYTPEMSLLLACAHKTLQPAHREQIAGLCHEPLDWPQFLALVDRHGVAPLVWRNLKAVDEARMPDDLRNTLRQRVEHNTRQALLLATELARLARLFDRAGIRVMPLKGPVLALQAYSDLALRHAGDLDLLVDLVSLGGARRVLTEAGYVQTFPDFELSPAQASAFLKILHHFGYTHRERGIFVELHWRWAKNAHLFPLDAETIWRRSESMTIGGTRIATLAREDLTLYLCTHGAKHAWTRLMWLCDIAELMDNHFISDVDHLLKQANDLGISRMLIQGLLLAHQALDAPLPSTVYTTAQQDPAVQFLTQVASRALVQDEKYWHTTTTILNKPIRVLYLLRLRSSLRYKRYSVFHRLLSLEDWRTISLPDRLFPLYFVLGPLLWIGRRLGKLINVPFAASESGSSGRPT